MVWRLNVFKVASHGFGKEDICIHISSAKVHREGWSTIALIAVGCEIMNGMGNKMRKHNQMLSWNVLKVIDTPMYEGGGEWSGIITQNSIKWYNNIFHKANQCILASEALQDNRKQLSNVME